jgi:ABC-type polysaccharide/polyol phosphate export permease
VSAAAVEGGESAAVPPAAPQAARRSDSLPARLAELWAYRHLIGNLVRRDLKVRYKNSVLGVAWSMVSPLLMMGVFWLVFSKLRGEQFPNFHVWLLIGILAWNWFSVSLNAGAGSVVHNAALINKVYFPREVLPISVVLSEMVNFLLALPVLFLLLALAGLPPTVFALWLPVIILIQFCFTLGLAFLVATGNVYYRDTAVILEVVLLAWFFLSPIFYKYEAFSSTVQVPVLGTVPSSRLMYIANPIASLLAVYRDVLFGATDGGPPATPRLDFLARTAVTGLVVLALGYWAFIRQAGKFGEEV